MLTNCLYPDTNLWVHTNEIPGKGGCTLADTEKNGGNKKKFNYDYPVIILLYLWSFVYLVATKNIESDGAKLFPFIVIGLSIFFATLLLLKNIFHIGKQEEYDFSGTNEAMKMMGMLLAYVFAVKYIGFYISTPIFLYLSMLALGQRNHKIIIISALLVPLFAYLLFDLALGLRIPSGQLF